jgi:hypothetical protein
MEVRLENPRASGEHATISWDGVAWGIRDLGSTNGSFVNGARLVVGERVFLDRNALVAFGDSLDAWRLVSDAPPSPVVVRLSDGAALQQEGSIIGIPSEDDPQVLVYWADHRWVWEMDGQVTELGNPARLQVGGDTYEVQVPVDLMSTLSDDLQLSQDQPSVGAIRFVFRSDARFEVGMDAHGRDGLLGLRPRAHHKSLCFLAQKRLADQKVGLPEEEVGWMEVGETAAALGIDPKTLNVHIFRAREELAKHGICGAAALVERRSPSRELRFGSSDVELFLD